MTERASGEGTREVISASWRRCLAAGIDPDTSYAPLVYEQEDIGDARSAHPLAALLPLLRTTLLPALDEAANIMVITDAAGHVLWREGHRRVMRQADGIGLSDGFGWSEGAVGTNGIGTALADGRAVRVYAAEHLARILHQWSCTGAPVRDPDSGRVIGCLDVSGMTPRLHPATDALVRTAARLAESDLALRMRERDERLRSRHHRHVDGASALVTLTGRVIAGPWAGPAVRVPECGDRIVLPDGRLGILEPLGDAYRLIPVPAGDDAVPRLTLTMLGSDHPYAFLDGARIDLSLRHAEIVTLLALHPRGLTAERLSYLLYGDEGNPVTIRAEIHRLRAQLNTAIAAKPYRLTCAVLADFLEVRQALAAGGLSSVARLYQGPLLPRSEAPAIRSAREELEARVRAQLLARGSTDDLWAYAQTPSGAEDAEVLQRIVSTVPVGDQRHAAARTRLARVDD
ncbi:GAF domain-containing protein [Microbispora sp. RL4-1S]|uniref:GAF domain-containing protein n=1 Tax=Microbispora oryzae TaxID=2806554 RepID=A0A941AHY6_9ACTN|nr:helix-turn-helix domain-containing protein [Microbispora oryzae]MBP2704606.1 GAF domain-containing protein [Microbispora oryzae]